MAQGNLSACLTILYGIEKGYVVDNGGPTNLGVTQATLSAYLGRSASVEEVQALDRPTATQIYQTLYWDKVWGDKLFTGLDLCVFDAAVNSGPPQAIKWLQRAAGAPDDGVMGDATLASLLKKNPYDLVLDFNIQRVRMMLGLDNAIEEKNEKGWVARVLKITQFATLLLHETNAISLPDPLKG